MICMCNNCGNYNENFSNNCRAIEDVGRCKDMQCECSQEYAKWVDFMFFLETTKREKRYRTDITRFKKPSKERVDSFVKQYGDSLLADAEYIKNALDGIDLSLLFSSGGNVYRCTFCDRVLTGEYFKIESGADLYCYDCVMSALRTQGILYTTGTGSCGLKEFCPDTPLLEVSGFSSADDALDFLIKNDVVHCYRVKQ